MDLLLERPPRSIDKPNEGSFVFAYILDGNEEKKKVIDLMRL